MRRDESLLLDMFSACMKIQRYTAEMTQQEFEGSEIVQSAVLREIQVIGEAARMISDDAKIRYRQIPWRVIAGMRNRIIHEYFNIDLEIVWQTIQSNIPNLIKELKPIIPENDDE